MSPRRRWRQAEAQAAAADEASAEKEARRVQRLEDC